MVEEDVEKDQEREIPVIVVDGPDQEIHDLKMFKKFNEEVKHVCYLDVLEYLVG